ncbi:hypothetical protein SCLCIDRAFT_917435 [Scleroderma citrinum Foug A]|uniref:Uncharacterized protein n=1 Tax=Scleroderma citrinum Foug A TaxID=1036808 RepID=A0A0C3DYM2_9AGAM|nr:hypothetical protein SCLCIDRAFT_917435 [Scleroderma citrinum Foug A]
MVRITIKLVDGADKQESPSAPLENPDGGTSASIDSRTDSAVSGPSTSRNTRFSNVAETVLPIVQAIGEGVPIAGGVIKAASGGALRVLQTKKTYKKNKEDLQGLVQRHEQIICDIEFNTFPCIQTPAQEKRQ